MCRAIGPGYRRCPYYRNPHIAAVADAKTSVRRFEQRLDKLEHEGTSDAKLSRRMGNYFQACERLGERE